MKRILITGFEPFGGHQSNPTEFIAQALDGERVGDYAIHSEVWPVVFSKIDELIENALSKEFDVVFHLGLAANRTLITPERIAVNLIDCPKRADNEGVVYDEQLIKKGDSDGIFSSLPLKSLAHAFEGQVSNTAGTYVCNYTMYQSLSFIRENDLKTLSGFIHIPPDHSLNPKSSYSIDDLINLLRKGILTL